MLENWDTIIRGFPRKLFLYMDRSLKSISGTNLEQAKSHNRRVVIEAIRTNGPLSRAAIARLTALTAPTAFNIIEELETLEILMADTP